MSKTAALAARWDDPPPSCRATCNRARAAVHYRSSARLQEIRASVSFYFERPRLGGGLVAGLIHRLHPRRTHWNSPGFTTFSR